MVTARVVNRESIAILTRHIEELVEIRANIAEVRGGDQCALNPLDRMTANLQTLEKLLGARVHQLGGTQQSKEPTIMPDRAAWGAERSLLSLARLFSKVERHTRMRADIVHAFGDERSARLLAQVRRCLVVLQWHAHLCAQADRSLWRR
jgi:hypothetical protein